MLSTSMRRSITADSTDAVVGSRLLYAAGLLLFALGIFKTVSLRLSESLLVLGLLATACASLQLIVLGMLVELRGRIKGKTGDSAPMRVS